MPLATKLWHPVSVHEAIGAFLRAESYKLTEERYRKQGAEAFFEGDQKAIHAPDFANPQENHRRLRLLSLIRGALWTEIPQDTEWFKVQSLQDEDLGELHAICRCGGDSDQDQNELLRVCQRRPCPALAPPDAWHPPLLWGHTKEGPFTIMEGNNRLIGYASAREKQKGLNIPVYIGLSPTPCFFHIFDPARIIMNDVWTSMTTPLPNPLAVESTEE